MTAHIYASLPDRIRTERLYRLAVEDTAYAWLRCLDLARQLYGNEAVNTATADIDHLAHGLALEALHRAIAADNDAQAARRVTDQVHGLRYAIKDSTQKWG